jgi:hypothetical protein
MQWAEHERELIRRMYPLGKIDELQRLLPHRTRQAIQLVASRMIGPTLRRYLTADERRLIASEYRSAGSAQLATRLGMNADQVRAHANRLGVSTPRTQKANP